MCLNLGNRGLIDDMFCRLVSLFINRKMKVKHKGFLQFDLSKVKVSPV